MMERFVVGVNAVEARWPALQELFIRTGHLELAMEQRQQFGYVLRLDALAWSAFRAEAEQLQLADNLFVRHEFRYDGTDLDAAELLHPVVSASAGDGGPTFGTRYDLRTGCAVCGTGAVQTSPLVLDRGTLDEARPILATAQNEILVNETLVDELRHAAGADLELRQCVAHGSRRFVPWFQLIPATTMPHLDASTRGIVKENQCPVCARDGHFASRDPLLLVYARETMPSVPRAAVTFECFGNGRIAPDAALSNIPQPLLLLGQSAARVLRSRRPAGVDWIPVRLV